MMIEADDRAGLSRQASALMELAQGTLGQMTPTQRAHGLQQLTDRLQRGPRRRALRLALALAAVAAAPAALLLASQHGLLRAKVAPPLGYQVEGGAIDPGGAVQPGPQAPGAQPTTVRFADGSAVKVAAGARVRLASVDDRGARFAIERGAAEVQVTPRANAHWLFDAGPFLITVHGTVFTAAWDENEGQLDVRLEKGLVSVTGPVAGGPIAVRGGQHLTVTLRQARVLLRALDQPAAAELVPAPVAPAVAPLTEPAAPPEERPAAAPRAPVVRPAASAPARAPRAALSWGAALAAGDFEAIVADAERDQARALASRSSDDLAALADAARYRRRGDLAREALLAQRRRFPSSLRATDAAFLLGRLEEGAGGDLGRAVKWYDRYLEEAPSGTYASEALGRKMVAVQKLYGTARARPTAEEYARRFPSGTYAGAARAIHDAR